MRFNSWDWLEKGRIPGLRDVDKLGLVYCGNNQCINYLTVTYIRQITLPVFLYFSEIK